MLPVLFMGLGSILVAVAFVANLLALSFEIHLNSHSWTWSLIVLSLASVAVFIYAGIFGLYVIPRELSPRGRRCAALMTFLALTAFAADTLVHTNCWVPRAIPAELLNQTAKVSTLGSCPRGGFMSRTACAASWADFGENVSSVETVTTWRAPAGCLMSVDENGKSSGAVFFNLLDQSRHADSVPPLPFLGQEGAFPTCNPTYTCQCGDCLCPDSKPVVGTESGDGCDEADVCTTCDHLATPTAMIPEGIVSFARVCLAEDATLSVFFRGHACDWNEQLAISIVHVTFGLLALLGLTLPYIVCPKWDPEKEKDDPTMLLHWVLEWIDIILLTVTIAAQSPDAEVFNGMQVQHAFYGIFVVQVVIWIFPMHVLYYTDAHILISELRKQILRWYAITDLLTDIPLTVIYFNLEDEEKTFIGTFACVFRAVMLSKSIFFNTIFFELVDFGIVVRPKEETTGGGDVSLTTIGRPGSS